MARAKVVGSHKTVETAGAGRHNMSDAPLPSKTKMAFSWTSDPSAAASAGRPASPRVRAKIRTPSTADALLFYEYEHSGSYSFLNQWTAPESCGKTCLRRTLVTINISFALLGLGLIAVGVIALGPFNSKTTALALGVEIPWLLCTLGGLLVVLAILGTCGQRCGSRGSLQCYLGLLSVLILAQLGLGALVFLKRSASASLLRTVWQELDNGGRVAIETNFDCCGFTAANDTAGLPCPASATTGCLPPMESEFQSHALIVAAVAVAFALLQSVALVAGCVFMPAATTHGEDVPLTASSNSPRPKRFGPVPRTT